MQEKEKKWLLNLEKISYARNDDVIIPHLASPGTASSSVQSSRAGFCTQHCFLSFNL